MGDAQDKLITELIARVKVLKVENEKFKFILKRIKDIGYAHVNANNTVDFMALTAEQALREEQL